MRDPISRADAIRHLKKRLYETALNSNTEHPYYEEIADNRIDVWMNEVPSVEPVNKDINVPSNYCEYCNSDSDGYVKPIERNGHAFIHFGMNGWVLSLRGGGWHGECKIRYCPMCGRELKYE